MPCGVVERCYEPITHDDLAHLAVIATGVLEDLFERRPTTSGLYRDRLLLLALCQGGGQHFVDQRHGVKDLDVWAFFRDGPARPFPWRSRWVADLGPSHLGQHPDDKGFEGRRVDVLGRSIQAGVDEDGIDSVRRWLAGWSKSARHLAQRPVVVVAPIDRLGQVIWPVERSRADQVATMAQGKFVSYLRVSTDKQGRSGLGLEAQRKAVEDFLNGGRWTVLEEFVEVESGSRNERPKLAVALSLCRLHGATLVIAKLDRLSRDAHFLLGLQKAEVKFVAADMPEANEMVVGIMAVVAQAERKMISARTKAALTAAKARGAKLGRPENLRNQEAGREQGRARRTAIAGARVADLRPILADVQASGAKSLREIAAGLNKRDIPTARGSTWSAVQVKRLLDRLPIG